MAAAVAARAAGLGLAHKFTVRSTQCLQTETNADQDQLTSL
jgi:hypothetical protein